jgi:hypothetical protein
MCQKFVFLIAVRSMPNSHVEKSGEGPHTGGAEALSQRNFFQPFLPLLNVFPCAKSGPWDTIYPLHAGNGA